MKVAIIAYYFKPDEAIGAVRPENWAGWLADSHEVTVVTKEALDSEASADDPYRIVRAASMPVRLVQRLAAWRSGRRLRTARLLDQGESTAKPDGKLKSGVLSYRMPCLHDLWLPDCYRLLKQIRPDIVIATHNPYVSIIAAWLYVIKHPEVKLWLDFRDPWTTNSRASGIPLIRHVERWIERLALERADMVTSVSRGLCREFNKRLDGYTCRVVYNAPAKLIHAPAKKFAAKKKRLDICYTGTVYSGWRDPGPVLKLFAFLRDSSGLSPDDVRLKVASRNPSDLFAIADRYNAQEFVEFVGSVSRYEARLMQEKADVLLLLESDVPEARGVLTGKLFEYFTTSKPILLVGPGPESELYQMLDQHQRLLTIEEFADVLGGVSFLKPGKPVDYSDIAKAQLMDAVEIVHGMSGHDAATTA